MIGKVSIGKSLFHCLSYCLEDKRKLSAEEKEKLSEGDGVQHLNRAEVLTYNLCYGDKKELADQFREVRKLSRRTEKPALHLTLRLAPGESLSRAELTEIGRKCAEEFGVSDHQYVCILHKDTKEQHIHLVANRVGFDGKAAKDGNNYRRMAALCRRLEKEYNLKQVLSPKAFLSPEERRLPRRDQRKEKLRNDIRDTLEKVKDYPAFERAMKSLGYQVLKGRGIAFIDDKKVRTKGSEVGFSLMKIEKILRLKAEISAKEKIYEAREKWKDTPRPDSINRIISHDDRQGMPFALVALEALKDTLDFLLSPPQGEEYNAPPLTPRKKKKRKKPQQHL
ncbi:MAG TPA: relaxase/mobilization nuclease domain-containing protein [Edaphocola sp.]|jgi:hypothetical protein|nr:relaxase/mobilization nuclease domain-containing protein [Edaphocola sp.]